jgi:HK97 family phage prohead protease
METRAIKVEVRASSDDPNRIEGYAAVFNSLSEDLGGFRERLMPGCFKRALDDNDMDVLCDVDHDPTRLLGRTMSKTCRVMQDENGLRFVCDMPPTQLGRDMMALIARGDYSQCSFTFGIDPDEDGAEDWDDAEGFVRRTIRSIAYLGDVSPVLQPAYKATSVSVK